MDYFKTLVAAGLTKKEAAVYIAVLEHGPLTLSKIAYHTHLNRPALYRLLPQMHHRGLVSVSSKGKRTVYTAESPETIEHAFEVAAADVKKELTALKTEFAKRSLEQPTVKFFDGKNAVTHAFDDAAFTLPAGGSIYRYTARTGPVTEGYLKTAYSKLRETKHLERYAIVSEEKAKHKKPKLNRHMRVVPKDFDLFEDNVSLLIYGHKTAYIDYDSHTSFIIESPKIAAFQEKLFKLLWKKLK